MDNKPTNENVREWLTDQMQGKKLPYLLAFADDGVIWGRLDGEKLVIAHETSQKDDKNNYAQLRGKTLQQAHAFGAGKEIRLFRDEMGNWQSVELTDTEEFITENQILWGDKLDDKHDQPSNLKFTKLLAERKGIPPQILPIERADFSDGKYIRLEVRHMVSYDENTGEAYIKFSRLAGLQAKEI